jgi:hypothetical protein
MENSAVEQLHGVVVEHEEHVEVQLKSLAKCNLRVFTLGYPAQR